MRARCVVIVALGCVLVASHSSADPVNLSFESTLSGWDVVRPIHMAQAALGDNGQVIFGGPAPMGQVATANQVSTADLFGLGLPGQPLPETLLPIEGQTFALLNTKNGVFQPNTPVADIYAAQTLTLSAGTIISGWARFGNGDYLAQDEGWVRIRDGAGTLVAEPWLEHSGSEPNPFPAMTVLAASSTEAGNSAPLNSFTPWVQWFWQAPTTGSYELQLGVSTRSDADLASYALFDAVHVPEPHSIALTLIGFCGVAMRRWAKRN